MEHPLDINAVAGRKGVGALGLSGEGFVGGDHWERVFRLKTVRLLGRKSGRVKRGRSKKLKGGKVGRQKRDVGMRIKKAMRGEYDMA
jgi:hypothetical protein